MTTPPCQVSTSDAGALAVIASLLEQRTGQQIAANRAWRLETALKPLMREFGLATVDALVTALVTARDPAMSDRVVDALLNQESSFFRDIAVLDQVAEAAVRLQREAPHRRLRLWSAGCSNGQEALSLAILLHERGIGDQVELIATDVSHGAVARARTGRYSQFEIQRGLSVHRMVKWFEADGVEWVADRALLSRIQFRHQNLVTDQPPPGGFDIVLCRNVLIYFSPSVRTQVFDRLDRAVRPGGLLVLGAGETVIGHSRHFTPSEKWRGFYRPATAAAAAATAAAAR